MRVIYKYQLSVTDNNIISMPIGAEILCVQAQKEVPCIWALVDTNGKSEDVLIETL